MAIVGISINCNIINLFCIQTRILHIGMIYFKTFINTYYNTWNVLPEWEIRVLNYACIIRNGCTCS